MKSISYNFFPLTFKDRGIRKQVVFVILLFGENISSSSIEILVSRSDSSKGTGVRRLTYINQSSVLRAL